jgi:hypothetical protein
LAVEEVAQVSVGRAQFAVAQAVAAHHTGKQRALIAELLEIEMNLIRQGDVLLKPVKSLPKGCEPIAPEGNRIVLAHGEVTGHAHAIYDHITINPGAAAEIVDAAIARANAKLWRAPDGSRYLEVTEPVSLLHEEHTAHTLSAGIYHLPTQVEYTPAELRRVAD